MKGGKGAAACGLQSRLAEQAAQGGPRQPAAPRCRAPRTRSPGLAAVAPPRANHHQVQRVMQTFAVVAACRGKWRRVGQQWASAWRRQAQQAGAPTAGARQLCGAQGSRHLQRRGPAQGQGAAGAAQAHRFSFSQWSERRDGSYLAARDLSISPSAQASSASRAASAGKQRRCLGRGSIAGAAAAPLPVSMPSSQLACAGSKSLQQALLQLVLQ